MTHAYNELYVSGAQEKIYVNIDTDFSEALANNNSVNMFADCSVNLMGGRGTLWQASNPTNQTCARIDTKDAPGYFTEKGAPEAQVTEDGWIYLVSEPAEPPSGGQDGREAELIGYIGEDMDIVIPSRITADGVTYPTFLAIGSEGMKGLLRVDPDEILSVRTENGGTVKLKDHGSFAGAFDQFEKLKTVDLSGLRPENTTSSYAVNSMFRGCTSLNSVKLPQDLLTDNSQNMFDGCTALKQADLRGLKSVSEGIHAICMFYNASSLESVNFSDTNLAIQDATSMFYGCTHLRSADLSSVKFLNSKYDGTLDLEYMFNGCASLESVKFDNGIKPTRTTYMFQNCKALTDLDLSGFDFSAIQACGSMFNGCTDLESIYAEDGAAFPESFDYGNYDNVFYGCENLTGGRGTTYSEEHVGPEYARIDGGPESETPGCFTDINQKYGGLSLSSLSFNFINKYGTDGLGYEESWRYHIPLQKYQEVFGDQKGRNIYSYFDDEWGGSCYGISATSSFLTPASFKGKEGEGGRELPTISGYDENAELPAQLSLSANVDRDPEDDRPEELLTDLRKFLEAMQISQYDERVQFCYSLDAQPEELIRAIEDSDGDGKKDGDHAPVIIGMFGPEGGHAVLGYEVERDEEIQVPSGLSETGTEAKPVCIHIYDSNWPEQDRKIELRTGIDGRCTGWHYDISPTDRVY